MLGPEVENIGMRPMPIRPGPGQEADAAWTYDDGPLAGHVAFSTARTEGGPGAVGW